MSLDKELMDVAQAYLSMHEKTKKEDASNDKSDDGDGMDKVDPKAAKKKFKDRKDKDIDNDGDVDFNDVMAFYQAFISGQANNDSYDFNGDGAINFFDIRALMAMCSRAGCAV